MDYIPKIKKRKRNLSNKRKHLNTIVIKQSIEKQLHLGSLIIGHTNNILPKSYEKCKIIIDKNRKNMNGILLEFDDQINVTITLQIEWELLKDTIKSTLFYINITADNEMVKFDYYFKELPLKKFNKKLGECLKQLFQHIFNIQINPENCNKIEQESIDMLFENIRKTRIANPTTTTTISPDLMVQHPNLKPQLRPYQANAIKWMLTKEQQTIDNNHIKILHPSYIELQLKTNEWIYLNQYTGFIEIDKPLIPKTIECRGGILADEMGLGKTVEIFGLILNNKKNTTSSSSSDDNSDKMPKIERITRKKMDKINWKQMEDIKPELPKNWDKQCRKKSQTWIAHRLWYFKLLQGVTMKKIPQKQTVQCICGDLLDDQIIQCKNCQISQHPSCFGFNTTSSTDGATYICSQCWLTEPLIESKATLIVVPTTLKQQWCNELLLHINDNIKILIYDGAKLTPIYPTSLIDYDLVLTTYNVLQSDFNLINYENNSKNLRYKKKYANPTCPLISIKWWRLCLDEAQTIDNPSIMIALMTQKFVANHRWAITGTPITKNLGDIYGLIDYLKCQPYNNLMDWQELLLKPYLNGDKSKMYQFLANILWRTSKLDVLEQINIPMQLIKKYQLKFSPIEQYFYRCQHYEIYQTFLQLATQYDVSNQLLTGLDKSQLNRLLEPFCTLRQNCTFPCKMRFLITRKSVKSMHDLLDALIHKNVTECEDALRVIISSMNGLGAIALLLKLPIDAIAYYQNVMDLYKKYHKQLNIDKLQIIHSLHNLLETKKNVNISDEEEENDDKKLIDQYKQLQQQYMKKYIDETIIAYNANQSLIEQINQSQSKFLMNETNDWYSTFIDWSITHDCLNELEGRIRNAHDQAAIGCKLLFDDRLLFYALTDWLNEIFRIRQLLIDQIYHIFIYKKDGDEFIIEIYEKYIDDAMECHLRPMQKKKKNRTKKCQLCHTNNLLKKFELKLFTIEKRKNQFDEMSLKGGWKPASEELVFKNLVALAKSKMVDSNVIKDGELQLHIIELLKKDFKEIRKLWTYLDQQICALDELKMCKMRLTLKDSNEQIENPQKKTVQILKNLTYDLDNKLETIHMLNEHELDYQKSVLKNEQKIHMDKLEKLLGTRSYLETLKRQQFEGHTPDPCPICKNVLENQWMILPCGHNYCFDCIKTMIDRVNQRNLMCSMCRRIHNINDISTTKIDLKNEPIFNENIKIKGDYSTKIEAIIRLIIELRETDENIKILLFSQWYNILKILKSALIINNINCELIISAKLDKQIENFKNIQKNITALLLPIYLGSKGLNLIEATHVVLIEPLINPNDELQAIGRVHRIGQTRPTVVHKFFIENTIEENIYKAVNNHQADWDKNKVTIKQLIDLFDGNYG